MTPFAVTPVPSHLLLSFANYSYLKFLITRQELQDSVSWRCPTAKYESHCWLLVVSQGGELGRTAGLPYKFEFYLRSRTESVREAVVGAAPAASPTLQHVALTLPPPVSATRPKP